MRSGPAVVLVRGDAFEGVAEVDGQAVHFEGRLRSVSYVDGEPRALYRPPVRRTWPLRVVDRIDWRVAA